MSDHLTALDATFLELEQANDGVLMSIGGVMVFDPPSSGRPPTLEEVRGQLLPRLTALPHYMARLSSPRTGRLAWPRWVADPHFDIGAHVHEAVLPHPGGEAELCTWAADFYSHRLDRARPLWEMALVSGLEGGRWALAQKTHHCLVDGVGSVDVVELLLDHAPDEPPRQDLRAPTAASGGSDGLVAGATEPLRQAAEAGREAMRLGAQSALHPRTALTRSRSLVGLLLQDEVMGAPHTSLNVPIGATRRFAVARVPLADLAAIRVALGGSINDVVLAACTTGLRRLMLERGERLPRSLRAMVPTNLRASSERLGLGNRVSSLFVELPVSDASPPARYRRIVGDTQWLKRSGAGRAAKSMLDLAALAPPILHAALARSMYATRLFNVTITNVPGPREPRYAFGARMREVHPVVPLAAEHAVGIAVFSYDGMVFFGVIADRAAAPDLDVLITGIEEGVRELGQLAEVGAPGPAPSALTGRGSERRRARA